MNFVHLQCDFHHVACVCDLVFGHVLLFFCQLVSFITCRSLETSRTFLSLTDASLTHQITKAKSANWCQTGRNNSRLCWLPLLVGSSEALRASSLTGRDLTRRTRGTATRGCLTGTTRGTGDTLPRYSNNLRRGDKRLVGLEEGEASGVRGPSESRNICRDIATHLPPFNNHSRFYLLAALPLLNCTWFQSLTPRWLSLVPSASHLPV